MVCGANGRYIGLIFDDVVKASDIRPSSVYPGLFVA